MQLHTVLNVILTFQMTQTESMHTPAVLVEGDIK